MTALLFDFATHPEYRAAVRKEFDGIKALFGEYQAALKKVRHANGCRSEVTAARRCAGGRACGLADVAPAAAGGDLSGETRLRPRQGVVQRSGGNRLNQLDAGRTRRAALRRRVGPAVGIVERRPFPHPRRSLLQRAIDHQVDEPAANRLIQHPAIAQRHDR